MPSSLRNSDGLPIPGNLIYPSGKNEQIVNFTFFHGSPGD